GSSLFGSSRLHLMRREPTGVRGCRCQCSAVAWATSWALWAVLPSRVAGVAEDVFASLRDLKQRLDSAVPPDGGELDKDALAAVYKESKALARQLDYTDQLSMYAWRLLLDSSMRLRRWKAVEVAAYGVMQTVHCREDAGCFQDAVLNGVLAGHRRGDREAAKKLFDHARRPGNPAVPFPSFDQLVPAKALQAESKAFWEASEIPLARLLEDNHEVILKELERLLPARSKAPASFLLPEDDSEDGYHTRRGIDFLKNAQELCGLEDPHGRRLPGGRPCWEEAMLYAAESGSSKSGRWIESVCRLAPRTCSLLQSRELTGDVGFDHVGVPGKACFIMLHPNSRIEAHSGPHNARLTVHLGLRIPEGSTIEVRGEVRAWEVGKAIVLDDSYVHHVPTLRTKTASSCWRTCGTRRRWGAAAASARGREPRGAARRRRLAASPRSCERVGGRADVPAAHVADTGCGQSGTALMRSGAL
ncbi:unnamed protein product, partial [Prorocentrum cordatum]